MISAGLPAGSAVITTKIEYLGITLRVRSGNQADAIEALEFV